MSGYIGVQPVPQATQTRDVFTATAGQTSFATSGYTPGFLDVYLNGVHLVNGTDYTASNGSDVVLSSGATAGDNVEVVAYTTFEVVDQSFSGNFSVDGSTFVVDAANNRVGIGTSSPSSNLDVVYQGNTSISGPTTGTWTARVINQQDSPGYNGLSVQNRWATADSYIFEAAQGWDGATNGYFPVFTIDGSGQAIFKPQGSEAMRLDASGNLLVGTTTGYNQAMLVVDSTSNTENFTKIAVLGYGAARGYGMQFQPSIDSSATPCRFMNAAGSEVGSIGTTSTSTSYVTSSDYRLKEDIQPMVGSVDRLMALKPVNFAWKVDGSRVDGFLAHEAQEVVPEAVTGEKDAVDKDGKPVHQGIDQSKLVPLLTAALQEALADIATLKAEVAALKGEPA